MNDQTLYIYYTIMGIQLFIPALLLSAVVRYTVLMLKKINQNQDGFSVLAIVLLIFVCVVIAGAYGRLRHTSLNTPSYSQPATQNLKTVKVDEGQQSVTVDGQTVLTLPSGATIDLEHFTFNPNVHDSGDVETNQIEHTPTFKAYHKGYTYSLSNYSCKNGEVFHDDYTSNDRLSCSFTISSEKSSSPNIPSYDGISFNASSQSRQIYDHSLKSATTSSANQSAYYDIEVPYMQFWGKGDGKYWGASGNTLRIKTVFGIGTINFNENSFDSDVKDKVSKSVKIGSVTAKVHMTGVSCYPPYLDAQGQCSPSVMTSGPYKGETVYVYNHVDYTLSFSQTSKEIPDHLVLHY